MSRQDTSGVRHDCAESVETPFSVKMGLGCREIGIAVAVKGD